MRALARRSGAGLACEDEADRFVCAMYVTRAAADAGLSMQASVEIALVAAELAANAARHGGGGRLFVDPLPAGGLQLVCIDQGPGIDDVATAVRDGWSSGRPRSPFDHARRSLGAGLGTALRLTDSLGFYPTPGGGLTVIASRR
ncbi:MAG: ATP-binding protein [Myxococcales bacterium]|nr:ATP-binding protein [Myxococcales bacterium]